MHNTSTVTIGECPMSFGGGGVAKTKDHYHNSNLGQGGPLNGDFTYVRIRNRGIPMEALL